MILVMPQSQIETLGIVKLVNLACSIEDKQAFSQMEETTLKIEEEDAYVSGLFWRDEKL